MGCGREREGAGEGKRVHTEEGDQDAMCGRHRGAGLIAKVMTTYGKAGCFTRQRYQ